MFQPQSTISSIRRALVGVVAIAIFAVAAAPAHAVTFPSSAGGGRLSHKFDTSETLPSLNAAVAVAKSHSMVMLDQVWRLGYAGTWDGTVNDTYHGEMKAANPGLLVFRYYNAVYDVRTDLPESWYMHNAAGHRLYNTSYRTYLMNPRSTAAWTGKPPYAASASTSSGWAAYLANWYRADVARQPGVFAGPWYDDIAGKPHVVDAVTGAASAPIDTDGSGFTEVEWHDMTATMIAKIQSLVGGARAGNALLSPYCYYTGCGGNQPLSWFFTANKLDDAMAEGFLRNWWSDPGLFFDVTGWLQSVQFLIDTNALGKNVQVTTALPTNATTAQVDQWRKYAYATFLLGNNGRAYFEFVPYGLPRGSELSNPLYTLDIGTPSNTAPSATGYANGAWYERSFTKGKVVVNPTTAPVTVSLGGSYLLPNGTTITSLTLAPRSGEILRLAAGTPSPPPPPPPSDGNLLSNGSFEGSSSGWGPMSSTFSFVAGGTVGSQALRVTRANYSTYGIIASPAPLTSVTAGAVYEAGGSIRSSTPGKQVCLVLREKKPDGTLVYKTGCVTSTGSWQSFPTVRHTVAATGSLIDFYIYQSGAVAGDSFELDGLTLRASSASPPSANLLSNGSFEGSTSGWGGLSSTLSVVGGGTVGTLNVKVTRANYSTYGIIASPAPVTSLTAGAVYEGGGSMRSSTPGKQVCLVLREKKPDGTFVYSTGCLTSTTSWQAFPTVRHTVAANGSMLDFYVYQSGAVTGDTFELDGLTLFRR